MQHIATCPPQPDLARPAVELTRDETLYTYRYRSGPVLYHAAPFAVVRWTNMWFPARFGFFGDWFGGPLRDLFGNGVRDIELQGNKPYRYMPALPHTLYFKFPEDETSDSVTRKLQEAMDLDSSDWLEATLSIQECPDQKRPGDATASVAADAPEARDVAGDSASPVRPGGKTTSPIEQRHADEGDR
jgi:hypothetical protein